MLHALEFCGRYARWVLPLGLIGGFALPWAAEPASRLIGTAIWLLLFLAVVRLSSSGTLYDSAGGRHALTSDAPGGKTQNSGVSDVIRNKLQATDTRLQLLKTHALLPLLARTLIAQLALPLLVFALATLVSLPDIWRLAATLVVAAPAISGSVNLVLLLRGDGVLTLRWLIAGTVLLPVTCLPMLMLVFDEQTASGLLLPAAKLLLLILSASAAGVLVSRWLNVQHRRPSIQALDGAASITLALMVIGLMSAVHAPDTTVSDFFIALLAAVIINGGLQVLGAYGARWLNQSKPRIIATGVVYGNRNIALYLTALPASFTEPLLLFIACYQIPMYLTPLIGDLFYRRLE